MSGGVIKGNKWHRAKKAVGIPLEVKTKGRKPEDSQGIKYWTHKPYSMLATLIEPNNRFLRLLLQRPAVGFSWSLRKNEEKNKGIVEKSTYKYTGFLHLFYYVVCVSALPTCVSVYLKHGLRRRWRASMWLLEIEPGSFPRTASALSHWPNSRAPVVWF